MDAINRKLLIITKDEKFIGILSIGDIQRAIINQKNLEEPVSGILRSIITVANINDSEDDIRQKMIEMRAECMPVIDDGGYLRDVIFWEDIVKNELSQKKTQISAPVIIMAGGMGTRLRPLTNVLPKPLIPIGDKTILEEIMDSFIEYGCKDFFISLNYKAEMIQYYLDNEISESYNISCFREEIPLGTAGSLHLLKEKIKDTFFVTNCDIMVDQDYAEIMSYHKEASNELTVVAALKHISLPYGTIETGENGVLKNLTEKPEMTFLINSGLYILEPHLIEDIPQNTFYHITTLIETLKEQNRMVGVFPVSEKSWKDIGEWKEYFKFLEL
jgi:dTDP-glucose pyrophosphorylase